MNLKKYICGTKNKIPRGAVSRVAEFLQQSRETSIKAIMGVYRTPEIASKAQDFVASGASFASKKMGRKATYDPRDILNLRAVGGKFREIAEALKISHETARKIVRQHEWQKKSPRATSPQNNGLHRVKNKSKKIVDGIGEE